MVNLVNMPVSRERMERYQNRYLRQVEHATKQWEGREAKIKNNTMRKEWIDRQNNASFRNECDRIQGALSHQKVQHVNVPRLMQRQAELHKFFLQVTYNMTSTKRVTDYGGLRKEPIMETIVHYLTYNQEKQQFPDREAKQIREHPYMTQLDFFDMQEDQKRAWEGQKREQEAKTVAQ